MLVVENQGSLSLSLPPVFFTHTLLQWRQRQFSSGFTFSSDQLRERERERETEREGERERERQQPQEQEDSAFSSLLPTALSARRAPQKTAPATGRDARRKYYRATGIFFYIFFFFIPLLLLLLLLFFFPFYVCFAGFEQRHTELDRDRERSSSRRRRDGRAAEVDALSHGGGHGRAPRPAAAHAGRHRRNGRRREKTGHWRHFTANYDHHGSESGRSPSQVKAPASPASPASVRRRRRRAKWTDSTCRYKEENTCWIIWFYSRVQV